MPWNGRGARAKDAAHRRRRASGLARRAVASLGDAYDPGAMSPAFLLTILIAGLLALVPVWRLHVAGWPPRTLLTAWVMYAAGIFLAVRFPVAVRLLIPVLVLAFVAPFVAGPERLSRVLRTRRPEPGVVINVTPRAPTGLPEPSRRVEGEVVDDATDDGTASSR